MQKFNHGEEITMRIEKIGRERRDSINTILLVCVSPHLITQSKPLQLPPINNEKVLKKFEKTLVGRILNPEIQETRVKVMLVFLPSVWKCEGRVNAIELERGGPYHFDGWMIAIERWVPTVRRDFPTTIPFWVKIMDLPGQYCEDDQLEKIGEDLGELMN
ncbi:unnamed protein product [Arabis nemorensis]|uniref:Uncharacterized protein n=1 Tax=Arabis nemorensis TaxID=586526 RepID=A0A565C3Y5_9BRAS|nr:unnamed protein product [Arabis nemorensis]